MWACWVGGARGGEGCGRRLCGRGRLLVHMGFLFLFCVLTRSFVVPHLFHAEVDAVVFRALEVGVTVQVLPVAVTVRLVEL